MTLITPRDGSEALGRRSFISRTGGVALSAAALALLGGNEALAKGKKGAAGDVDILNVALGLEHEAIAAYQLGAESKLLSAGVLPVAVLFQSHHKEHRDALVATIKKLGGKEVASKSLADYAKELGAGGLKSEADVLGLARKLELGAINAYLGVIPAFADRELAKIAGRLAADETSHWAILNNALGGKPNAKALGFGA
jgi:hypothetical protein